MQWQFYPSFWPLYTNHTIYISGYEHIGVNNLYSRYVTLGPLQMNWYFTYKKEKKRKCHGTQ